MNTKIVVDSSASLYTLQGVDFECVPLKIITDDAEYLDNGTMDAVGMAQTLRTYKGKTSTSCPNVSDWLAAYEGADEVYAITITGTLSGSYNAAQLAAEEYQQENPGKRVFVLDSLSTGPEQRLLAEHLRDLLAEGKEFDEVCEEMLRYHKHTHLLFSLESLANLARNGRVKPAVAAVARPFYVATTRWGPLRRCPPSPPRATKPNIHDYSVPEESTWLITNIPCAWAWVAR